MKVTKFRRLAETQAITPPPDLGPQTGPPKGGRDTLEWLKNNWPAVWYRLVNAPAHRYARLPNYKGDLFQKKHPDTIQNGAIKR